MTTLLGVRRFGWRARRWVVVLTLALAGLAAPTTGVRAEAAPAQCWTDVPSDLDGGGPDVVVGLPGYDLPSKADAGAIVVFSNVAASGDANPRPPTATRLLTAADFGLATRANGRFGASVAVWAPAFDDPESPDRCADLLVGIPGDPVDGKARAGRVVLLNGVPGGLGGVLRSFDESGLAGGAQAGAGFGSALGVSSSSLIAVGAPGRDVGGAADAGRVVWHDFQLPGHQVTIVQQGDGGVGAPEAGDRFGEVLDVFGTGEGPLLAIGVPQEDVGSAANAGAVALRRLNGDLSMITQNSPGAGGTAETGDRFGASVDLHNAFVRSPDRSVVGVTIGVPGENVGRIVDAGAVAFGYVDLGDIPDPGDTSDLTGTSRVLTQDSPGQPGVVEAGDQFGAVVLAGEFGHESGHLDLVVGAPLENLSGKTDAGALSFAEYDPWGALLPSNRPASWSQDSPGVAGVAEHRDQFGSAASAVLLTTEEDDDDSIWWQNLVTVPTEDVGGVADAGMAYLGYPPGKVSVALNLPVRQRGAGIGMVPMKLGRE